jgi:hypothetical protein
MEGDMPELLEDSTVQQGLPGGFGHEDFTAMMQMWAVVEDLPEVVNAEVDDAIEELTQLTLISHVVAVQTDEVLEQVEPPKEPPEMSDVEQALITLMDYTKSTAGSSKQHELFISLQTRVLNERTNKKLAATAQLSPMRQSGWELRESQQGSSTSAASSTAGGLPVPSFFNKQ